MTNSNTILSDASESIVNVIAGFFGLISLYVALIPKDKNHPYGHGKIEFISAGIEGALIFIAGIMIIFKSLYNLQYPHTLHKIDYGLSFIALTGIINFLLGFYVNKKGVIFDSSILKASGKHLISDAFSTIGTVGGLVLIYLTEQVFYDILIAIILGLYICYTGFNVIKDAFSGIMDEADFELLDEIVDILNEDRHPECIDIHNLRIIKYGTDLHVDCHMTIPWYFNVEQAHDEVKRFEDLLSSRTNKEVEFFVHTDPCIPSCCKSCIKMDCTERKFNFEDQVVWNAENLMKNKKHNI